MKILVIFLVFLSACTNSGAWMLDQIPSGEASYNLSRLEYQEPKAFSPLKLEFLKMGEEVDCVISLNEYASLPEQVSIRFTPVGHSPFEETILLSKGRMRMHLSKETQNKLIKALQDGSRIDMVVDDIEESLSPSGFARLYDKFIKEGFF